eukprot:ANDGO_06044.mRNA.1 Tobamovirus multiplication protein 1
MCDSNCSFSLVVAVASVYGILFSASLLMLFKPVVCCVRMKSQRSLDSMRLIQHHSSQYVLFSDDALFPRRICLSLLAFAALGRTVYLSMLAADVSQTASDSSSSSSSQERSKTTALFNSTGFHVGSGTNALPALGELATMDVSSGSGCGFFGVGSAVSLHGSFGLRMGVRGSKDHDGDDNTPSRTQPWWLAALEAAPAFALVAAESAIIIFYAQLNHYARNLGPLPPLRPLLIGIVSCVSLTMIGLDVMLYLSGSPSSQSQQTAQVVVVAVLAALFVLTALGFALFGLALYAKVRLFPVLSGRRLSMLSRVRVVTLLSVTCFTTRAVMILSQIWVVSISTDVAVVALYFIVLECLPVGLLLWALDSRGALQSGGPQGPPSLATRLSVNAGRTAAQSYEHSPLTSTDGRYYQSGHLES